ncbi:MAG TPA: hypothetical protein VIH88_15235 [Candidatus Acidoferrales bacterium]
MSRRAISSVLSRHARLKDEFAQEFGDSYPTVRDFYLLKKNVVVIQEGAVEAEEG